MNNKLQEIKAARKEFEKEFFASGEAKVSKKILQKFAKTKLTKWHENQNPYITAKSAEVSELYKRLSDFPRSSNTACNIPVYPEIPEDYFASGFSKLESFMLWEIIPECWQIEKKQKELSSLISQIQRDLDKESRELMHKAEDSISKCQFERALPFLNACAEKEIPDFTIFVSLSNIHMFSGELEKAQEFLGKGREVAEKRSSPYYTGLIISQSAFIDYINGKSAQAYFKIKQALELSEDIPGIYYQHAIYCLAMEDWENARSFLIKAIDKDIFYSIRMWNDTSCEAFEEVVRNTLKVKQEEMYKAVQKNFHETELAFKTASNVIGMRILPRDMKEIGESINTVSPIESGGIFDFVQQGKFFSKFTEDFFRLSEASMEKVTEEAAQKHTEEEEHIEECLRKIDRKRIINYTSIIFIAVSTPVLWSVMLAFTTPSKAIAVAVGFTLVFLAIFLFHMLRIKKEKQDGLQNKNTILNFHLKLNNIIGNILKDIRNRKPVLEPYSYDKIVEQAKKQGFRIINEEKWYSE